MTVAPVGPRPSLRRGPLSDGRDARGRRESGIVTTNGHRHEVLGTHSLPSPHPLPHITTPHPPSSTFILSSPIAWTGVQDPRSPASGGPRPPESGGWPIQRPERAQNRVWPGRLPIRNTWHDRGVEGLGQGPSDQPLLRVSPRHGTLVALCLGRQRAARTVQVGSDGRLRLSPRPARPLSPPAGHRWHWIRRHPAQPDSPAIAADGDVNTIRKRTTPSSTTSSGCTSRTPPRKTESNTSVRSSAGGAVCARPGRLQAIDRGAASKRSEASVEARQAAGDLIWEGTVQLLEHEQRAFVQPNSIAFPARSQARLDRRDDELRGAGCGRKSRTSPPSTSLPHARRPERCARAHLAEDHPTRRPLAVARDQRRSALPAPRYQPPSDRRRPPTHLRRSAQLCRDPLCPTAVNRRRRSTVDV